MPRLIHVNGPPGIGKSSIACRYVADHPFVLNCDIDTLRTLIGGWQQDFGRAGELIRPAALAFITAYLESGYDVVLPQMLVRLEEIARFEQAAVGAHAEFVEIVLMDEPPSVIARFHRRGSDDSDPWHDQVRAIVAEGGGDDLLARCHDGLIAVLDARPAARIVRSREGHIDETYQAVLEALG